MVLKMKFVLYSLLCLLNRIPEESLKNESWPKGESFHFETSGSIKSPESRRPFSLIFFGHMKWSVYWHTCTFVNRYSQIFEGRNILLHILHTRRKVVLGSFFFNRYFRSLILILTLLMCTVKISPSVFARFRT